jgi:hypothetical protein
MVESFKNHQNRRRGISTIIGGIIFIVLLTAGFSSFFVAMDVQSDTVNTQRTISDSIIEKTQEQFSIGAATGPCVNQCPLGIQVKNEGPNPIQISNVWIINKSLPNQPAKNIPINYGDAFIPSGYGISILENQVLKMDAPLAPPAPDVYDIKVVSAIGTIKQTELNVGGSNYLLAELFTIPPDVRLNENVTIALRVTNVGPTLITGIVPNVLLADDVALPHGWVNGMPELVSPVIIPAELEPTESTIFSWQSNLNGAGLIGGKIKFSNFATGTESTTGFTINSNTASDKLTVRDPKGGAGEEIVIKDELFGKPDVFMLVPNTFGTNADEALWGITVANPTDAPMEVTKVSITALYATANSNQEIFTVNCDNTNIAPSIPGDFWSCPNDNQLIWYDPAGYTHTIPARSAFSFLVTADPGKVSTGTHMDSVIIHASVFTSLGAFGEASWNTSMKKTNEALVNVYLYEEFPPANPPGTYIDTNFMQSSRLSIPSASTQTFHVALAELGGVNILPGATLIINVPKDWAVDIPSISDDGFTGTPTHFPFPDGSSQIVGTLTNSLASSGKIISFDAVAPSVLCDKMYVMHVLANGKTTGNNPIGPLAEIVLQVNPAGVCP